MAAIPTAFAFQQAVTASAVVLANRTCLNGFVIKAKATNSGKVFVGGSGVTTTDDGTGNGFALAAGESVSIGANSTSLFYIIGTASDVVYVMGN
jgi:hypothetical protein